MKRMGRAGTSWKSHHFCNDQGEANKSMLRRRSGEMSCAWDSGSVVVMPMVTVNIHVLRRLGAER
jgi:hypothetical protein